MINDLGATLEFVARTVPDGILIFFPSYRIMETTRDEWCKSGIFKKIHKCKTVYMEPKNSLEY